MTNNSNVYLHRSLKTGKVFYVGKGNYISNRAYRKDSRSKAWNDISSQGYSVEIVGFNLTTTDALKYEEYLINNPAEDWDLVNFHKTNTYTKIDDLSEHVRYDESSPSFLTWNMDIGRKIKKDTMVGYINKSTGYWCFELQGKSYLNHRVIWTLFNSDPGELCVNHIDTVRVNNHINNLEKITLAENNRKGKAQLGIHPRKNNTSGVNGISIREGDCRVCATLYIDGKRKSKTFCSKKHGIDGGVILCSIWLEEQRYLKGLSK